MNPTIRHHLIPCAGLLLLLFGMTSEIRPAAAQGPVPPPLDHYKAYLMSCTLTNGVVTLRDQFGTSETSFQGPFLLGTPASKNFEGIYDDRTHLTWYEIHTPEPLRSVTYTNQFGEDVCTLRDGVVMLVPALKNEPPGDTLSGTVNHFKCYQAEGNPPGVVVTLDTQFGREVCTVDRPELFCNPAEKILTDGTSYPIVNPDRHLVCYRILPPEPLNVTGVFEDQFLRSDFFLRENFYLCVPTDKGGVVQNQSSTWGRLKGLFR